VFEDSRVIERVDELRQVPAQVRFLSCEPLIGPLNGLSLKGIDWVIVGGESGPAPGRWMNGGYCRSNVYVRSKRFHSSSSNGRRSEAQEGRLLNERTWDDMPASPGEMSGLGSKYATVSLTPSGSGSAYKDSGLDLYVIPYLEK